MQIHSVIQRASIGVLLGGIIGIVAFSATRYQWSTPFQGALSVSYSCNPEGPSCSDVPVPCNPLVEACFPTLAACMSGCTKPIFCCKNWQSQTAVCNSGVLDMENVIRCDGEPPPFYTRSECNAWCLPPSATSSSVASSLASSLASSTQAQQGFCCNTKDGQCSELK